MLEGMRPTRQLALLGVLSGLLTTFVKVEAFVIGDVSVLPGIFFGAVLAYGLWRWQTKSPLPLIGLLLLVIVAWYAAYMSGILLHDFFRKSLGLNGVLTFAALGLIAGLIGSAITAAAVYLFAPAFRDRAYWKRVVMFGTVAGVLLALPETGLRFDPADLLPWLSERQAEWMLTLREAGFRLDGMSLLPLFVIWQSGVGAIVARGITGLK